jgi:phytol kinase
MEIETEILRKGIHFSIASVPFIASFSVGFALFLLGSGILIYSISEYRRFSGYSTYIIGKITVLAARERDMGKFVLGPVTLALGAMLSLLLYPNPAATIAIYALAFGDGFASLVGKLFGTVKLPYTGGKTLEGSLACFTAVFVSTYSVTGRIRESFAIALLAMLIEALPLKDLDNIYLPYGVGFVATMFFAG